MKKLRMTIELEYDPEHMYGPDGEQWAFFEEVLGADSGLALTSMLLGGDIVGPVQVISAVEVVDGHEHTQNQG
jgi:hypothetical protein